MILRRENRTQVYTSSLKAERTGKWIGASLDQEQVSSMLLFSQTSASVNVMVRVLC